jgi:hypothetical protein
VVRIILQFISWAALAMTILPAFGFLAGTIELTQVKTYMFVASCVWFVATPLWMGRDKTIAHEEMIP